MSVILAIHPGTVSQQYALFAAGQSASTWQVTHEKKDECQVTTRHRGMSSKQEIITGEAAKAIFTRITHEVRSYCEATGVTLDAVVVQVAVPGTEFQEHRVVNPVFFQLLKSKRVVAPLLVPQTERVLQSVQHHFPNTTIIAASDTAFHATMPPHARAYSFPIEDASTYDIYRFGSHGLVVSAVVRRIHAIVGQDPARMVVCNLGEEMSVTAVRDGRSVDTSAGYSITGGVSMTGRGGDIDAAAILALSVGKRLTSADAEVFLHSRCGLAGLTGDASLIRLLARRASGDESASVAVDMTLTQLKKQIGAMVAVLGGIDVLVFTGPVGLRSSEVRAAVCTGLDSLGLELSIDRNDALLSKEGLINTRGSRHKVAVMSTDPLTEMAAIAHEKIIV